MPWHCLLVHLPEVVLVLGSGNFSSTTLKLIFSIVFLFLNKFLKQVVWRNDCLLSCLLSSTSLHNIPGRLFPGQYHHLSISALSTTKKKKYVMFWLMSIFLFLFNFHFSYICWTWLMLRSCWPQEEDLHLENVYYSEMKDAGFFDADWEWCHNSEYSQCIILCIVT